MAPELKRYLHFIDLDNRLRDELAFSDADKIRMYTDFDRTGVRLRGTYNRFSQKMEFPLDTDLIVTLPKWAPDAVKAWVGFSEVSVLPDDTSIGWKLNDGTNDYYWRDYPTDLLVLARYNDFAGQTFTLNYFRDGSVPTITPDGTPAIVAPGVAGFGAGALELNADEGLTYRGGQLVSFQNIGTVRFRVKPGYSGTPVDTQAFLFTQEDGTGNNGLALGHLDDGNIVIQIADNIGSIIILSSTVPWNPVSGTWYEWELVLDTTIGSGFGAVLRIGGSTVVSVVGTGDRSGEITDLYAFGSVGILTEVQNYVLDEVHIYNTVQHTSDYTPETSELYTPAWEIAGADDWNTEVQITDHIDTFQYTQKEITPIANLRTTDKDVTPVLKGYGFAIDAQFDWWEDIIIRSLIPRLREDFEFIHDEAPFFSAGGTTFNLKTDEEFIPDQDLTIVGVDAVYDHDNDPNHETDLLSSYDIGTGEVTLTGAVAANINLYIRMKVQPQVVINYPNTDFVELGKTPGIIVENVAIHGDQTYAQSEMVDKKTVGVVGYKTEAPYWAKEVIIGGMVWAGGNVDAQRVLTRYHSFLVKGSSRSGHKPGGILQSKALGVYYTMRQRSPFRHGPRAAITDLKSSTFQIVLSNVYVWLNDVVDKPVVSTFNYALARRRDAGPEEEFGVTPPLNAGVIKTLYQKPEIEES